MTLADYLDVAWDILRARWECMLLGAVLVQFLDGALVLAAVGTVALERRRWGVR